GGAHRPRRILVRKNPRWAELVPHLKEIGVEAVAQGELLQVNEAFGEHMRRLREARSAGAVKPSADQEAAEKLFPAVAKWVRGYGLQSGTTQGGGGALEEYDQMAAKRILRYCTSSSDWLCSSRSVIVARAHRLVANGNSTRTAGTTHSCPY